MWGLLIVCFNQIFASKCAATTCIACDFRAFAALPHSLGKPIECDMLGSFAKGVNKCIATRGGLTGRAFRLWSEGPDAQGGLPAPPVGIHWGLGRSRH